jgi:hypothetical protein
LPNDRSHVRKVQAEASDEVCKRQTTHGHRSGARRQNRAVTARDPVGVVAVFLRQELAEGPVLVSELDALARAAGLLGAGHPITHAKLFKRAKKLLGIQSVRNGFGAGEWLWRLEERPPPIAVPSPLIAEPSSVTAPRIPFSWIEGVRRLDYHHPPADVPPHRWHQFLGDCNAFLTSGDCWAERAAKLGWDAVALFGCHPTRPLSYLRVAGLLWAINSGRIVELHRDWAVIELAVNGSRCIFERRRVDATTVTLPWAGS